MSAARVCLFARTYTTESYLRPLSPSLRSFSIHHAAVPTPTGSIGRKGSIVNSNNLEPFKGSTTQSFLSQQRRRLLSTTQKWILAQKQQKPLRSSPSAPSRSPSKAPLPASSPPASSFSSSSSLPSSPPPPSQPPYRSSARYETPRRPTGAPSRYGGAKSQTLGGSQQRRGTFIYVLVGTLFAAAATYSWIRLRQDEDESENQGPVSITAPQDPSARYQQTAATFDEEVQTLEKWTGINALRRRLARRASGHVLEVSAGTGRNLDYYQLAKCRSLTFLDQAGEMTAICRSKFTAKPSSSAFKAVRFVTQSALDHIDAPPGGFDTIVQTMGLCSTGDPVGLLQHLGQLVNQEHGRILLLEHGRSIFTWLNRRLDRSAPRHAAQHGCWWNRDIDAIVHESGLEVVKRKRYLLHAGTTYWYELRPSQLSPSPPPQPAPQKQA